MRESERVSNSTGKDGSRGTAWFHWTLALPLLASVAPILYVWSANAGAVELGDVLPLLALVVAGSVVVTVALALLTRSPRRTALTVAAMSVPVTTFGWQLRTVRGAIPDLPTELALAVYGAALLVVIVLIWRLSVDRITAFFTVVVAIFCATTIPGIGTDLSLAAGPSRAATERAAGGPDIYYIMLDGYGRNDVLTSWYDFNNSAFLDGLRDRGFYVADASYSNYSMTYLSLSSTLNMEYVSEEMPYDYDAVDRSVEDAAVIRALRDRGYRYVHLETEFWMTANAPLADVTYGRGAFESEFERVFFEMSLLGYVLPARPRHEAILNAFDDLKEIPNLEGPTFTLAHLLVPHPPFMFDAQGNVIPYTADLAAPFVPEPYVEHVQFVNRKITEVVDTILATSDTRPIIILQGDHGPQAFPYATPSERYWERHAILNAMLVPEGVRERLYPSITSVNTFRVLLSGLFGADLPRLEERVFYNWYVSWDASYPGDHLKLFEVTDLLPWEPVD